MSSGLITIPILLFRRWPNLREASTFFAAIVKFGIVLILLLGFLKGSVAEFTFCQLLPGLSFAFRVDGLGVVFGLVASSLWIVTSIYSIGYMRSLKEHSQTRFFCFFAIALSATIGVAFSANLLTMYLFYELLSLSTFPLVTHHQDQEARTGGRTYLSHLLGSSVGLALPAMIITYMITGDLTFNLEGVFESQSLSPLLILLLGMFLYGFAKSGLMPLHSWLPGAMVAPTPVSALLHAVAVVKVGVFCVVRVVTGIFGMPLIFNTSLGFYICVLACVTILVASLVALTQDNLKRLLAFSTVGQLSYIILGVGIANYLGVFGSVLHIVMHAFGKITLFFCAGAIYVASGKKYISQMNGIGRVMPYTMTAFMIGAFSIAGLPGFGGFISKWHLGLGAIEAGHIWIVVVLIVSSFLNICYFLPIIYKAFFLPLADSDSKLTEPSLCTYLPPVITAFCSVLLFFLYPYFKVIIDLFLIGSGQ